MQWESGSWDGIEGILYMASGYTGLWTLISAALCVVALVIGSRHELDAYKKAENGQ